MLRLVVHDGAPGGSVQVVVLTAFQGPEKAHQTDRSKHEGERDEIYENFHYGHSFAFSRARNALSITIRDDPDIAAAAISGVTSPAMAIGTARTL
jgi:hypothetical protein